MKRFIKIFILMLLMTIASDKVIAVATCVSIGNDDNSVCVGGGEVPIYGGSAKLEFESGNYTLTLKNVNITEYKVDDDKAYGIYFDESDLTIKLVGDNKISFIDRDETTVEEYYAAYMEGTYSLKVIGDGTLSINANGDYSLIGLDSELITIGEENKTSPTINANMDSGENGMSILISGDFNIYNTNIKGKIRGALAAGLYSNNDDNPCNIKNSDINLDLSTSSMAVGVYAYNQDLTIEDTDILIKMHKFGDVALEMGIVSPVKITIKDSRLVIIASEDADTAAALYNNDDEGILEFLHTDGKEFLFVANDSILSENVIYDDTIENAMVYVHSNSLEDIKLTSEYNISNVNELVNEKYMVITTGIDNKIISGNNQNIKKNSATSYEVSTNHFRYLVKEIKLDDTVLDEVDYELSKDGKVILTDSGISKLNNLDIGTYKLKLDYYAGDDLEVDFNIVNEISNPNTGDNIILYIIMCSISLTCLVICILYKKNKI